MTDTTKKSKLPPNFTPFDLNELQNIVLADAQSAQAAGERFVVFFLNERLYGMASKDIAEVTLPLPVSALPSAPEWLYGIANLRGEIVTVLDLPRILGEEHHGFSGKGKFVILQTKNYASAIAFAVDRLSEIAALPAEKIEPFKPETASSPVYAKARHQAGDLHLLDARQLLSALPSY